MLFKKFVWHRVALFSVVPLCRYRAQSVAALFQNAFTSAHFLHQQDQCSQHGDPSNDQFRLIQCGGSCVPGAATAEGALRPFG